MKAAGNAGGLEQRIAFKNLFINARFHLPIHIVRMRPVLIVSLNNEMEISLHVVFFDSRKSVGYQCCCGNNSFVNVHFFLLKSINFAAKRFFCCRSLCFLRFAVLAKSSIALQKSYNDVIAWSVLHSKHAKQGDKSHSA